MLLHKRLLAIKLLLKTSYSMEAKCEKEQAK